MQGQNEVESLYREYSGDVYRYLLYMCRNPHVAEDLCQSTFLKVISGIRGVSGKLPGKNLDFYHCQARVFSLAAGKSGNRGTAGGLEGNGARRRGCGGAV
ncbi:MAG: sigma factor [Eisenbergiella massiliensis]